jgi:ssDNA-binding Zn-finger/Zn-ribbon topoisomerase 1
MTEVICPRCGHPKDMHDWDYGVEYWRCSHAGCSEDWNRCSLSPMEIDLLITIDKLKARIAELEAKP